MTIADLVASCTAIAHDLERASVPTIDFADAAYTRAFFAADLDDVTGCVSAASSAFVLAIVLASCGWPT